MHLLSTVLIAFNILASWNIDDDDEDDDELDQEIGIQKTLSQKQKSLNSQDIKRNIDQIVDDDEEDEDYQIAKHIHNFGSRDDNRGQKRPFNNRNDGDYDGENQRHGPGGQRGYQQPRPKYDEKEIDMNSNFRKYYFKDKFFYQAVIDNEDPAPQFYKFKVHVFQIGEDPKQLQDQEKNIFFALAELNAQDIRITTLPDKFRAFCYFSNKEDAKRMYTDLQNFIDEPMRSVVFLDLPEEVFVKHGDIEADKYNKQQEENKKYNEEKQYQNQNYYDNPRGGGQQNRGDYDQQYYDNRSQNKTSKYYDQNNYNQNKGGYHQQSYNNQQRSDYQQDYGPRGGKSGYQRGQDYNSSRKGSSNYHQDQTSFNDTDSVKEAEKIGIRFGEKPHFYKGANPNEDREDHRRVINTAKKDQQPEEKQQIRTVVQQEQPTQNRQVEFKQQNYDNRGGYNQQQYQGNNNNDQNQNRNFQSQYKGQANYKPDGRKFDNQRDNNYYKQGQFNSQQKQDYQKPRGRGNNLRMQKQDSQSNYDYETHSQISDTLSHHSYRTDHQNYKSKKYSNNDYKGKGGYGGFKDQKDSYPQDQQQDDRYYEQNQNYYQGGGKNYNKYSNNYNSQPNQSYKSGGGGQGGFRQGGYGGNQQQRGTNNNRFQQFS